MQKSPVCEIYFSSLHAMWRIAACGGIPAPSLANDRKKLGLRTPPGKWDGAAGTLHYGRRTMLEADLQNLTSVAHEPSSLWIRKSDGPEAAHAKQVEPSAAFIWSPGRFS
jgi:hypothetical protein